MCSTLTCTQIVNLLKAYPGLNELNLPFARVCIATNPRDEVFYRVFLQNGRSEVKPPLSAHSLLEYQSRNPEKQAAKKVASGLKGMLMCYKTGRDQALDHAKLHSVYVTALGLCKTLGIRFETIAYPATPLVTGDYSKDEFDVLSESTFYDGEDFRVDSSGEVFVHQSKSRYELRKLDSLAQAMFTSVITEGSCAEAELKYNDAFRMVFETAKAQHQLVVAALASQANLKARHAQFFRFD